ncbi:MAG: hypothetical protein U9P80_04870 [Thermodesulfobacteriota bacterium]|nr:hypothetical protein [Thermodesulfobacteriota bacterium]
MQNNEYIRRTVMIVLPVAIVACLVLCVIGCFDIAFGVLIGVSCGVSKSLLMIHSVVNEQGAIKSFFLRYLIIAIAFILGIMVSMGAFYGSAAGLFFVHIMFIVDQVRSGKDTGGIG